MVSKHTAGVWVNGQPLTCVACGSGTRFHQREIKMNTTGMSFFDLDWLNRSADGAICSECGFLHTFYGDKHQWGD